MKPCAVCGSESFESTRVLWPELIAQWELSEQEARYIDRQQGFACTACGANLRSMALASAIVRTVGINQTLKAACASSAMQSIRVLEINPAGSLTPVLSELTGHRLVSYPAFDMHDLAIESAQYDLVVHSDTLEHLENPTGALAECRRVLVDSGACVFTTPIIPTRMTRSRSGLAPSYHGAASDNASDLLVHWEFGADAWAVVLEAGFTQCQIHCIEYPAGLAVVGTK